MTVILSQWNDLKTWDEFVDQSAHGSVFVTSDFLTSLQTPFKLFEVQYKNQTVAGFPILFKDDNKTPMNTSHYFTLYQGLVFSKQINELAPHSKASKQLKITELILEQLTEQFDNFCFCLHPTYQDLRAFQWLHYHEPKKGLCQINIRYTGLLDLTPFEDFEAYLKSIRQTRRNLYKKTLKSDLKIVTGNQQDVALLAELYQATFTRQDLKETDEHMQLLVRLATAALQHGYGELLFCETNEGQKISASLFLHYQKTAYYLFGANHPDFRKTESDTLLVIENIKRCLDKGMQQVDFVGINSPGRGDFKTSFNATPAPYFVVQWGS